MRNARVKDVSKHQKQDWAAIWYKDNATQSWSERAGWEVWECGESDRVTYLLRRTSHIYARVVFCLIAQRQVAQLVALVEHAIANHGVNEGGDDAASPDGDVVNVDAV